MSIISNKDIQNDYAEFQNHWLYADIYSIYDHVYI